VELQEKTFKVSVCVVTYNQEKYIRQCLQSIVDQVVDFDFEVIVGDDCSTDKTCTIVREFEERYPELVKPIFHKKNIGAYQNYAFIHDQGVGEYTAHMDGDDYWFPNKLSAQVAFMENNRGCVAVYSNAIVVEKENQPIGIFSSNVKAIFDTSYLIRNGNFLCNSSMLYKSALRAKVFMKSSDFIDYQVHIKLSENGLLGFIDANLVAYRSDSSGSVIENSNRYIRSLYLKALLDVDSSKVKSRTIEHAFVNFLANAMLYELVHGSYSGYKIWVKLMKSGSAINSFKVQFLAFLLFSKIASSKLLHKVGRKNRNDFNHVFHKK
jgi:glycosyltransferase involved in cell wall biosynthesis